MYEYIRWRAEITDDLAEGLESVSFTFPDHESLTEFLEEMEEWLEFNELSTSVRAT